MRSSQDRRLAVPALAERARTLAARGRTAAVMAASITARLMPMLLQVEGEDSALLLVAQDGDLPALVEAMPGGEVSAMIEVTDMAPVVVREPVRGLLWITGWLRALATDQARTAATRWVEQRPDPRLLDIGHTASMMWLDPVFVVFSDSEVSGWLTPAELATAEPDPFCQIEHAWLRHLERYHPDVLRTAVGHALTWEQRRAVQVRPLGLDRFGVRLRIEGAPQEHDVRLAFRHPATTPVELASELYRLLGCSVAGQKTR